MADQSIFLEKTSKPTDNDLTDKLGTTFDWWKQIRDYVILKYPDGLQEWNFSGAKYGWSFRIKDKKRAIIYLLPRDNYFKVAFVFGQKAFDAVMASDVSDKIKNELNQAKKYAEGRGIRISINNLSQIKNINKLIDIKLAH